MIEITKIFKFHSAHFLPYHKGKCKGMHGHTFKLEVTVIREDGSTYKGKNLTKIGMVEDFGIIKAFVKQGVIEALDHWIINDLIINPTAENIALWAASKLNYLLEDAKMKVRTTKVVVWETDTSYATWREE